jgi:hypothetical protein
VGKLLVVINNKAVGIVNADEITLFKGVDNICFAYAHYSTYDHVCSVFDPVVDELFYNMVWPSL